MGVVAREDACASSRRQMAVDDAAGGSRVDFRGAACRLLHPDRAPGCGCCSPTHSMESPPSARAKELVCLSNTALGSCVCVWVWAQPRSLGLTCRRRSSARCTGGRCARRSCRPWPSARTRGAASSGAAVGAGGRVDCPYSWGAVKGATQLGLVRSRSMRPRHVSSSTRTRSSSFVSLYGRHVTYPHLPRAWWPYSVSTRPLAFSTGSVYGLPTAKPWKLIAPGERAERTREEQNGNDDGSSWRVEIVRQESVNTVGTTTTRTARARKVAAVAGSS